MGTLTILENLQDDDGPMQEGMVPVRLFDARVGHPRVTQYLENLNADLAQLPTFRSTPPLCNHPLSIDFKADHVWQARNDGDGVAFVLTARCNPERWTLAIVFDTERDGWVPARARDKLFGLAYLIDNTAHLDSRPRACPRRAAQMLMAAICAALGSRVPPERELT